MQKHYNFTKLTTEKFAFFYKGLHSFTKVFLVRFSLALESIFLTKLLPSPERAVFLPTSYYFLFVFPFFFFFYPFNTTCYFPCASFPVSPEFKTLFSY